MKKSISCFLILTMIFLMSACDDNNNSSLKYSDSSNSSAAVESNNGEHAQNNFTNLIKTLQLTPQKTNDSELDAAIEKIFKKILKSNDTALNKIRACYNYIVKNMTYETPTIYYGELKYASEYDYLLVEYAKNLFSTKRGGCDSYASGITILFRALGLESYMVGGKITESDDKTTLHSWCIVKIDNTEYIFDPLMQQRDNENAYSFFGKTFDETNNIYKYEEAGKYSPEKFKSFKLADCETLGHQWEEANCSTPQTCNVCGATKGDIAHTWDTADCTKPSICKICGRESSKAMGHDFTNATCLTPKTCKNCGLTEGERSKHKYTEKVFEATCTDGGRLYHICTYCSNSYYENIPPLGHSFDEWKITKEATKTAEGEKMRTCSSCNTIETDIIDKIPYTETDMQNKIFELVNNEREKAGLLPFEYYIDGQAAANKRVEEIITKFSNTRPDNSAYSTVLDEFNISYTGAEENIASGQTNPEAVMTYWMNSDSHRKNILGNFKYIIVGFKNNHWVQIFIC